MFTLWLRVPLDQATRQEIGAYVDHLLQKAAVAEDDHLPPADDTGSSSTTSSTRRGWPWRTPSRKISIRLPKPLPRHLKDGRGGEVPCRHQRPEGQGHVHAHAPMRPPGGRGCPSHRRCGRVPEKAGVRGKRKRRQGQGRLLERRCPRSPSKPICRNGHRRRRRLFLVQKGPLTGTPISVRGIQKRIEYYARKSGLHVSCHRLRHTFATQLLNADADLATIQDLLGHDHITTTQRYCRVANLKVQRDYYKAMETGHAKDAGKDDDRTTRTTARRRASLHRGNAEKGAMDGGW